MRLWHIAYGHIVFLSWRTFMTSYPKYKVGRLPSGEAYVVVTRKGRQHETWFGFNTEEAAQAWIAKEIAKRRQSKTVKPPRRQEMASPKRRRLLRFHRE
jgi:hypothetical protein